MIKRYTQKLMTDDISEVWTWIAGKSLLTIEVRGQEMTMFLSDEVKFSVAPKMSGFLFKVFTRG